LEYVEKYGDQEKGDDKQQVSPPCHLQPFLVDDKDATVQE
jgi:hypothetical protein